MAVFSILLLPACVSCSKPLPQERSSSLRHAAGSVQPPRVFALLINGGDRPESNYQSHYLHVQEVVGLLEAAGIERHAMAVFSSDGADPAPDLAVLDPQPERAFWLIETLPIGAKLKSEIRYESSTYEGLAVWPATKQSLHQWFDTNAGRLREGDTLLLYVTDHGRKGGDDPADNSIVLWGETLTVRELGRMLLAVPRGVRVLALMSQCFSGGFAELQYAPDGNGDPYGDVCGYFSSTPERQAYGCYPENRGKHNVGHSFQFVQALRSVDSFADAHDLVLLTDRTPDVPNRTSDTYLEKLLARAAGRRGVSRDRLVDELLAQAWQDEGRYGAAFDKVDRVGEAFGSSNPRSLADVAAIAGTLPSLARDLRAYARRWHATLGDLASESYARFLEARPFWRDYVADEFLDGLDGDDERDVASWLVDDFRQFLLEADPDGYARVQAVHAFAKEAEAAAYRMEVRLGTMLRLRSLLTRIAGEVYLRAQGSEAELAHYDNLVGCESFRLTPSGDPDAGHALAGGTEVRAEDRATGARAADPVAAERRGRRQAAASRPGQRTAALRPGQPAAALRPPVVLPPPFPPMIEEMKLIATVLPGWMGVEFRAAPAELRARFELPPGAVVISSVYSASPAEEAGIRVGDVILGPPNAHFERRTALRAWVTTAFADEVRALEILRNGQILTVDLRIGVAPGTS